MSFSENLQFLRKQQNMTQEQLAEDLGVSRQAVSKWESAQSYPEMDKLLQMCRMFACDMDTLVQKDVSVEKKADTSKYDETMNRHSYRVTGGVVMIILGMTAMTGLENRIPEGILTSIFLLIAAAAVYLFIITGIKITYFGKRYPEIMDFYTEEERHNFGQKFAIAVASGVALIILGVCFMEVGEYLRIGTEEIRTTVFMLLVTVAVGVFVYFGMQKEKMDIEKYNREHSSAHINGRLAMGKITDIIMLLAVVIFVASGLCLDNWRTIWVVFPVAGILCMIAELVWGIKK